VIEMANESSVHSSKDLQHEIADIEKSLKVEVDKVINRFESKKILSKGTKEFQS